MKTLTRMKKYVLLALCGFQKTYNRFLEKLADIISEQQKVDH